MTTYKWRAEQRVNTTTTGAQEKPAIAVLGDGSYIIVWEDHSAANSDIRGQRFAADGSRIGAEFAAVANTSLDETEPTITVLADGTFAVGYTFATTSPTLGLDVYLDRYNASGQRVSDTAIGFGNGDQQHSVVGRFDSGYVDIYVDSAAGLVVQKIGADGSFGPSRATFPHATNPDVAELSNGNLVMTWYDTSAGEVFHAVLTPDLTLIGGGNVATAPLQTPHVTALAGGAHVVTYMSNSPDYPDNGSGVRASLFSGTATLIADFELGSTFSHARSMPDVVALHSGGFVAVWEDLDSLISLVSIRAQAFDPLGNRVGQEMIVSTGPMGFSLGVSAAVLPDDRVVVTWDSNGGDDSTLGVLSQIIDPRDGEVNGTVANDTLYGGDHGNEINGLGGNDTLFGGLGVDVIFGGAGNDTLIGGPGTDRLDGGDGTDTASYQNATAGIAASLSDPATNTGDAAGDQYLGIENLTGSARNDTLTGDAGANALNGGAGADKMSGLGGNDFYYVDNVGDTVTEAAGAGSDRVLTSISYELAAGQSIELFTVQNSAATTAIKLAGNELGQTISGNAGADVIDGKGGADVMKGLGGSDTYFVDNTADQVVEAVSGGTDLVYTSVNYTLGAGQEIETLSAANVNAGTALSLTGNERVNLVVGNAGANIINGRAGNDTLTGKGGADKFLFNTALNAATNVDHITDFTHGTDKIDLENAIFTALTTPGTLAVGAFFAGAAAHDADDRIIYNPSTGALIYDSNGNVAGGATQFATLAAHLALSNTDFVVV